MTSVATPFSPSGAPPPRRRSRRRVHAHLDVGCLALRRRAAARRACTCRRLGVRALRRTARRGSTIARAASSNICWRRRAADVVHLANTATAAVIDTLAPRAPDTPFVGWSPGVRRSRSAGASVRRDGDRSLLQRSERCRVVAQREAAGGFCPPQPCLAGCGHRTRRRRPPGLGRRWSPATREAVRAADVDVVALGCMRTDPFRARATSHACCGDRTHALDTAGRQCTRRAASPRARAFATEVDRSPVPAWKRTGDPATGAASPARWSAWPLRSRRPHFVFSLDAAWP